MESSQDPHPERIKPDAGSDDMLTMGRAAS